jgi:oligopeptide/dipeptide ABC transporter ATP-binding protein
MADEVAVMYLGKIVEFGGVRQVFHSPQHPYTQALLRSIPKIGRKSRVRLEAIKGTVPVPLDPPDECPYARRCPQFIAGHCDQGAPEFIQTEPGHLVRCVLYEHYPQAATLDEMRKLTLEGMNNEKQVPKAWLRPYHKRMDAIRRKEGSADMEQIGRGALKHCLRQIDALIRFFREASYFDTPETRAILLRCLQETRNQWATEGWRTLMGLEVNISA